jgi:hypothetical protein
MQSIAPDLTHVARLSHKLDHVLRSPGVHLLRDPGTQRFNFDPYLAKIHQPRELDLRALPPFTPASRDPRLRTLALELGTDFSSSTSSISPIFAQFVHFVTRFRPLNLFSLSGPFAGMTHQSTRITTQPIAFHVRPIDSGYAVDSCALDFDVTPNNLVLIDLGKSLEAMLTMKQTAFEDLLLKRQSETGDAVVPQAKKEGPRDVFHYLKAGGMLLRAQLDCVDETLPGENKTFDIKTRATVAVRRDCGNYRRHTGYRLSRMLGEYHSYEREYYDMARSAFLKYNMQVRIGRMNGVFVAFHNTQELFGFEYLPQEDLDECLFGSTALGDRTFELVCQLTEMMLRRIVADSEQRAGRRVALRCFLSPDRNNSLVHLFVEEQSDDPGWRDQVWRAPAAQARTPSEHERRIFEKMRYETISQGIKGPIGHYTLAINVLHNGQPVDEPFTFAKGNTLDVEFGWVHVGHFAPDKVSRIFWETVRNCK